MSSLAVRLLVAGTLLASPASSRAQTQADTQEAARSVFTEGAAHFEARRYPEALAAFERSYHVSQSPNALLMMARCQRELGQRPDAVATFERADAEARQRVAAGEPKYVPTAEAAADEAGKLRAALGTIHIRVEGAGGGSVVADGKPIALSPQGDAVILREPGMTSVEFSASGVRQQQIVTVSAGASVGMSFTAATPKQVLGTLSSESGDPTPPSPPAVAARSPRYALPAWLAGGMTIVGGATFAGFGLSSSSTFDKLAARCGPANCGPSDRAEADRGVRAQTIANIGLGVAITAAVATVVFVVLALDESRPPTVSR